MKYIIYTDGAYSPTRDQGGLGIVFIKDNEVVKTFSKCYKHTTNNQMEIGAVYLALKSIRKPIDEITIITDSQYVIGCVTKGWKRRKNQKLWKAFDKIYKHTLELCPIINFQWVKGHQDSEYNNLADFLANSASQSI